MASLFRLRRCPCLETIATTEVDRSVSLGFLHLIGEVGFLQPDVRTYGLSIETHISAYPSFYIGIRKSAMNLETL